MEESKDNKKSNFLELIVWICALIAFFPAIYALFGILSQSQQLRDALVILVSGGIVIAIKNDIKFHAPQLNKGSLICLFIAYGLFFGANLFGIGATFAVLAGLSAVLMSIGLACIDKPRYVFALGGAFYAFSLLSILIRIFDFPLRVYGGKAAVWILSSFNDTVKLMLLQGNEPQIILQSYGQSFVVAAECNGFGIISSGIVFAMLFAIFRKNIIWWGRIVCVVGAALIAFFANSLRIVSIVIAAPIVGQDNYHFMHETFGYIYFAIGLIVIWLLCSNCFSKK